MQLPHRHFIFFALLSSLAGCSYIPFAGGALDGTVTEAPADWRSLGDISIIQLETQPNDPYSVKLWMIAEERGLFVFAGDNYSQWVENIDNNPLVRVKIEDKVYPLAAKRVSDEAMFQQFAQLWLKKYDSDRTDSTAADTYLYQLVAR